MFSYASNKNSQSTLQNHLIEQIQFIANQIFDPQSISIPRTELQEMSLQLSPATSQQPDSQIQNHHQNLKINFFTNILSNQKSYHQLSQNQYLFQSEKKTHSQLKKSREPEFSQMNQQKIERLTKSMISSQNFKEPGSFSKNYLQKKDVTGSQVSIRPKKNQNYQLEKKIANENSPFTPLTYSSLNKSNILKGLVNEKNTSENKSGHKKGRFSESYSSNYISPYSSRGMKQNPKSYMQKSVSQNKKSKQALQIQSLKQKIKENIQPQISHRIQKASKPKNISFSHVKSKYKQTKPLIYEYQIFAEQHIYKTIKQQISPWHLKNNQYKNFSHQQIQNNWEQFIKNQQRFIENKKQWLAAKKLQKFQQQKAQIYPYPNVASYLTEQNSIFESNPHKMTPQDFVKKYKREKDKLKQKLKRNQISNFLEKTYFDSIKEGRQIFKSGYGMISERQDQNENMELQKIKGQTQKQQDMIKMILIDKEKSQGKKGQQNFFISVGSESPVPNRKQKSFKNNTYSRKNTTLAQSSIYEQKIKSKERKTSRDLHSQRLGTERSSKKKDINNSFSPFRGKQNYFSKQQSIPEKDFFNGNKQNIHQLSRSKGKMKQKSVSKTKGNKQDQKVKQLSNPKYFKSIVQMREYSSNSKQRRDNNKRTLQKSHNRQQNEKKISTKINSIQNKKNTLIQGSRQNRNQDYQSRHKTKEFDQTLMNQIVKDLNLMRSQIQENKKNRKYKIQNYSNFSNLRQQKRPQLPSQQTGFFNVLSSHGQQQLHFKQNVQKQNMSNKQIQRFNNHFNTNYEYKNEKNKQKSYVNESRSISPIQREQSIMIKNNNRKQFSVVDSDQQRMKDRNQDMYNLSRQLQKSNIILVKNRQEIEFVLNGQQSNEQKD